MINYNITSKHISNDPYGIEKSAYKELEKRLVSMIEEKLSSYKNELISHVINVDIDMNSENIIDIKSPSLPNDLRKKIQQALNELGK